jgi:hypothetical protein
MKRLTKGWFLKEQQMINPSSIGILSFHGCDWVLSVSNDRNIDYQEFNLSSLHWELQQTTNSETWISLDIYFLFGSIGKHHNDIQPKCLATETYCTTLCIGPLLTIVHVSFHTRTHKDLASLQTPKHFHICPLCEWHIALVC